MKYETTISTYIMIGNYVNGAKYYELYLDIRKKDYPKIIKYIKKLEVKEKRKVKSE